MDATAGTARLRARAAYDALAPLVQPARRLRRPRVADGPWPGAGDASVWALSQVLAGAVSLVRVGALEPDAVEPLLAVLERYRIGDGYGPYPGDAGRYYDDNAWVGLDLVGLHLAGAAPGALDAARRVLRFVAEGEDRRGGVAWVERPGSPRNTCATAPAGQLAAWVHLLTGDDDALAFAWRCRTFLATVLRRDDHLYADHIDPDGSIDHAIWSYNQGTPVGLDLLLHRAGGDAALLDDAAATAAAAIAHFGAEDRLWAHAPCFNAIWLRNLVPLHAVAPVAGLPELLGRYADRLWTEARDPATGWFDGGGIGRYERGGVLDQGGVAQVLALAAYPPALAVEVV